VAAEAVLTVLQAVVQVQVAAVQEVLLLQQ
jgi:hypothetical protein